jgi:hypothetical protein
VVPATSASVRPSDAAAAGAPDAFRTLRRPEPSTHAYGPLDAAPIARPAAAVEAVPVEPTPAAAAPAPLPLLPVEPSVRVAAAHLVDPVGLRVVPFRPTSRWPLRRAATRIGDPFRGFPLRSMHLADLMDGGPRRR